MFTDAARFLQSATGDPFQPSTKHGPVVSQTQFDVSHEILSVWHHIN